LPYVNTIRLGRVMGWPGHVTIHNKVKVTVTRHGWSIRRSPVTSITSRWSSLAGQYRVNTVGHGSHNNGWPGWSGWPLAGHQSITVRLAVSRLVRLGHYQGHWQSQLGQSIPSLAGTITRSHVIANTSLVITVKVIGHWPSMAGWSLATHIGCQGQYTRVGQGWSHVIRSTGQGHWPSHTILGHWSGFGQYHQWANNGHWAMVINNKSSYTASIRSRHWPTIHVGLGQYWVTQVS